MMVNKCDLCKKEIAYEDMLSARIGFKSKADLCIGCGKPIIKFLKKNNFIKKEKIISEKLGVKLEP